MAKKRTVVDRKPINVEDCFTREGWDSVNSTASGKIGGLVSKTSFNPVVLLYPADTPIGTPIDGLKPAIAVELIFE
jgi:hypothetical protein